MRSPRRPPRRVWLLTLTAVGGALLAACVPVPPPPPVPAYQAQYCSGGTPRQAADYQAQHDGLRTVNTDFGAGDNGAPVDLGNGKTLWLFADTWSGYIRNGAMADPYRLVRNAFVVQTGGCLTPIMGGSHGARTDLIPAPAGQYYWPMGAYVDGSILSVFAQRFVPGPGLCGCIALDIEIARFALPDLRFIDVRPSPAAGLLPEFGNGVVTANGFHYIFGRNTPDGLHPDSQYVARVPVGTDPSTATWQYWNGGYAGNDPDNWTLAGTSVPCAPGSGGACPMQFEMPTTGAPLLNGPSAPLWVIPQADGTFLASAKLRDVYPDPINTWSAPTPYGPWTQRKVVASTPAPSGGFTYNGRVFQLPGGALTASYNTNAPDNDHSTDVYKVLFRTPAP